MARSEEKAQSMLNKFLRYKEDLEKVQVAKRPALASMCDSLEDSERFRMELTREIAKGISDIQNGALGEHRIRDLNDEINRLLRTRHHWERRIIELGGPDYTKLAKYNEEKNIDSGVLTARGGYKYFGAAKDLPGVRELFESQNAPRIRTRRDLFRGVDGDYYGFRDEEDGIILPLEDSAERIALQQSLQSWEVEHGPYIPPSDGHNSDHLVRFTAHVELPSSEDIEKIVLARRKQDLLKKLASVTPMEEDS